MAYFPLHTYMAAFMSGFKDGRQVIVPVPLEFTDMNSCFQNGRPSWKSRVGSSHGQLEIVIF